MKEAEGSELGLDGGELAIALSGVGPARGRAGAWVIVNATVVVVFIIAIIIFIIVIHVADNVWVATAAGLVGSKRGRPTLRKKGVDVWGLGVDDGRGGESGVWMVVRHSA